MYERDAYAQAHRKGPGFGLFLAWVITTVLATAAGERAGNFIESLVPSEGPQTWLNYLLTGTAYGAIIGLAQGTVLLSYLGLRGLVEWTLVTVAGRVARIMVLAGLFELTAGVSLQGNFFWVLGVGTLMYAGMGAIAGLVLGAAQSLVLRRAVIHPGWWILANMGASAVALGVLGGLGVSDYAADVSVPGIFNGLVTGVITGIALNELLREPVSSTGWWLTWKRERPVKPGVDAGTPPSPEALLEKLRTQR